VKSGICWIKFKENMTDEEIQEMIGGFYLEYRDKIVSMGFDQLKSVEILDRARKAFYQEEGGASHNKDNMKEVGK
jgi:hypothetical protein